MAAAAAVSHGVLFWHLQPEKVLYYDWLVWLTEDSQGTANILQLTLANAALSGIIRFKHRSMVSFIEY